MQWDRRTSIGQAVSNLVVLLLTLCAGSPLTLLLSFEVPVHTVYTVYRERRKIAEEEEERLDYHLWSASFAETSAGHAGRRARIARVLSLVYPILLSAHSTVRCELQRIHPPASE